MMLLRYARYAFRWRRWPSPLQREFMRGDPHGRVRAVADAILTEIREEEGT
jgi:hypothetical protein